MHRNSIRFNRNVRCVLQYRSTPAEQLFFFPLKYFGRVVLINFGL